MKTISGVVREIERVRVKAPNDGVHRASIHDGYLKGVRCFMLNDMLLPKGQTGFFWQYSKDYGLKVFYKIDNEGSYRQSLKAVKKEWRKRKKLEPYDVIPDSPKIVKVNIDVKFKKQRIKTWSYAIKTAVIHYPKEAWDKYAQGHPYDFSCVDHPDHSPDGYHRFCKKLTGVLKKTGVGVCGDYPFKEKKTPKLGDVVWCCEKNRWYLVDCG